MTQECNNIDREVLMAFIRAHVMQIVILSKEIPDEELKCLAIEMEALLLSRFRDDP